MPTPMCTSDKCERAATHTVYWPGQTRLKCDECLAWARRVAEAMGFELQASPLPPPPMGPLAESRAAQRRTLED